ncbi:MAG TPA: hypothetical protein VG056_09485 [Pirellulales bacterium]|nr:hypothetical protein [Pirellulales bacterium]
MDSSASDTPKPIAPTERGERPILATLVEPPIIDERPVIASPVVQGYDRERVYGVSRRFSLATIMMMMAGTSLLLTIANALSAPPMVSGMLVLLCIAVALGQMFLFGGEQPRKASVIVGGVTFTLMPVVVVICTIFSSVHRPTAIEQVELMWLFIFGPIYGALLGYLAGGLVAGVLLVMDLTESMFARWRKVREPDDDPWPPPKNSSRPEDAADPRDTARIIGRD